MKKIIVVNKSFSTGGIQSSMVNMVNELVKYCEVDLFVYNPEGPMKERISSKVSILESSYRFRALGMSCKQAIKTRDVRIIWYKLFASIWAKLFDNRYPIECAIKYGPKLEGYDLAISFHQEQHRNVATSGFTRVVDKMIEAKKKLAWVHFDSSAIDLDKEYNEPYYQEMDKVVCVSKSLRESFATNNPSLGKKVDYCYNFMDYDKIMADSRCEQKIKYPKDKIICFSASRLTKVKALVRAIEVLAPVFRENNELVWFIAGDGNERSNIENAISREGLDESIILLGNLSNPYPYMKNADFLMNVSYHEAAPMVFLEAKALGVPVFATETSSAKELLEGCVGSAVCENSENGIYNGFREFLKSIKDYSKRQDLCGISNEESVKKIMSYLED